MDSNSEKSIVGHIDPIYIKYQVLEAIFLSFFINLVALIVCIIINSYNIAKNGIPVPNIWFYAIGIILFIFSISIIFSIFLSKSYVKNYVYEISEENLIIRSGTFTRKRLIIPLKNIQNIEVFQNVRDRILKIHTIRIETVRSIGMAYQYTGIVRPEGYIPAVKDPDSIVSILNKKIQNLE
ncbi:PH domain-containing protein [Promethearchaeum syntrophicum]|uniref:PH domain-containing protein n=1 Tax=Promethearchaeum syntrophicum TaxID=2594042 RepID=A0A5B9D5G0_9ARCH|nr:PH domain-containing protein [Candidatus Prometheoarchaeum syntrophicum]QEE14275.1 Bacterial membrane flanked domain protein [Candidatus Prometheoarchaeum syntrophicum]